MSRHFYNFFRFFGNLNRGSAYAQGYGGTSYTDDPPSREATAGGRGWRVDGSPRERR